MKRFVVSAVVAGSVVLGANAFDLGDAVKGLEKAGVVKKDKSADEIMQENFKNKKNVQECKKYYHKYKIAFAGTNDVPHMGDSNANLKIYNDNRKNILSKADFDMKKYTSKKNETAQYLCQEIMSANESDFSSLRKETAKYEK